MGDDSDNPSTRATRPARLAQARIRGWWRGATFGTDRPARRVAALGALGLVTGAAEAATVILIVALASGSDAELPLIAGLPDATGALAALALAAVLVLALSHVASALIAARAAVDAERSVQNLLVEAYLAAPWSRQAAARTGELQDLVTVRASLLASGTEEAARALATALNLTVVVAVAVAVSAWAAAALLAVIALAVLVARPFQAYRRRVAFETAEASADLSVEVTETARAARDLRVFGVVSRARNRLRDRVSAVARSMLALRFSAGAVPALTRDLAVAALVGGLALVVSRGDVSLAQLGAAVVLVLRALAHAQELVAIAHGLQDREANLELIRRRLADWAPQGPAGDRPCAEIRRVELRSVSYRYPGGERHALREANLDLRRGEQVGIVGRTGAGKSTLAAIVLGLLRPDGGEVLVDGTPLSDIEPSDWNRRVAWIGQEPHLLTGTVAENIRFLRPELDPLDIARAAEAAGLGREIEEWPLGLDHPVGPEGAALSGGQRQRVALARALAGEPDLLVLDEPTSALDAHAEAAVRETLAQLRGETIVVVIAHRLSTINACDRIALVDAGRIAALAPPHEVAASQPYFREALELSDLHA